ncbi:MAG TPA: ABC transporter permease [Vicinamibacteria bacterium]|nr:ABC transporter permease [Vicinamibacteria bacterium]
MSLSWLMVRIASWLVPRRERSEWRLEWESEIWHYRRELAFEDRLDWRMEMKLLGRSLGAVADALDLRSSPRVGEGLGDDLRYGLRMLRKSPGFTLVAVLLLALGIGATTAIFSVVNGVLLKPLPFEDPESLVMVWESAYKRDRARNVVGPYNFLRWRERARSFASMSAFVPWAANLAEGEGEPERVAIGYVSADLFSTLGVSAARGRVFTPEDGIPGNERVVLLGDGLWKRRFGADPDVVGRTLRVDGTEMTIVGVLPPGVELSSQQAGGSVQIWNPMAFTNEHREARGRYMLVMARLLSGVTLEQAQEEMKRIAADLEKENADFNAGWSANVFPLQPELVRDVRGAILVLFAAVGAVLLIACANVGNLLLTRAVARERELSVRAALGARRFRILRQLLVESLLLAGVGGVLGLALAEVFRRALLSILPAELPAFATIGLDSRVLAFTFSMSVATSLLFGLLPALQVSRLDLVEPLKEGARGGASAPRQRLKNVLVTVEIALAVVLLVTTGLLIRSFHSLSRVNPGFQPAGLTAVQINLAGPRYETNEAQIAFYQQALAKLQEIPTLERAGAISWLPLGSGLGSATSYRVTDKPDPPPGEERTADVRMVAGDLFRAMGIPLLEGRGFEQSDRPDSRAVVVVNQTLAETVWPGESPIGKIVEMSWGEDIAAEVVGVVGDVRLVRLETAPRATLYWPQSQLPNNFMSLIAREKDGRPPAAADLRAAVATVDPELPLTSVQEMEDVVARSLGRPRLTLSLMSLFGVVALLLAAIGLYGVVAFSVSQRVREIGLRMALGASSSDVSRLVLREGLKLALAGVALGVVGALFAARFLESMLYEVEPRDPMTLVVIAALLIGVALVASYLPARRASRIDPFLALRTE